MNKEKVKLLVVLSSKAHAVPPVWGWDQLIAAVGMEDADSD